MSYRLVLRPRFQKDIAEGDAWYEDRSPGLGDRFLLDVQRTLGHLLLRPGGAQRVYGGFRQVPLNDFPYVIIYRLDRGSVVIMRAFHTSQHPKKKFRRKKK